MARWRTLVPLTLTLALAACNSGSSGKAYFGPGSGSPPPGTGGGGGGGGVDLTFTMVSLNQANQTGQLAQNTNVVLAVFTLTANTQPLDVTQITFTNTGTLDETTFGQAQLYTDANNDQDIAGETVLGTAPALAANDDPYVFTGLNLSLPQGGPPVQVILAVPGVAAANVAPAHVTQFKVQVASPSDIVVSQGTVTATGNFGMEVGPNLGIHTHLLISEVAPAVGVGSTGAMSAEFVEIFNPTSQAIALDNYHLTDASRNTNAPGTNTDFRYELLADPTGANTTPNTPPFGPAANAGSSDFQLRFPAGASIPSGAFQVVAISDTGYRANYANAPAPTYYVLSPAANTTATPMRGWSGTGQTFNPVDGTNDYSQANLTNTGEGVMLFTWDGAVAPNVVTDVDYVYYGPAADPATQTATNTQINKSGVTVNGTAYQNETPPNVTVGVPANTFSVKRTNWTENGEATMGGNGIGGHDEVGEPAANFDNASAPTPFAP
ncbi:MAG: hypothetical protein D6731_14555 [Planctomycetota bacterium]|nr:MAG: hypothetical protein D6731_14555 [Planctomycetota bacterium]